MEFLYLHNLCIPPYPRFSQEEGATLDWVGSGADGWP